MESKSDRARNLAMITQIRREIDEFGKFERPDDWGGFPVIDKLTQMGYVDFQLIDGARVFMTAQLTDSGIEYLEKNLDQVTAVQIMPQRRKIEEWDEAIDKPKTEVYFPISKLFIKIADRATRGLPFWVDTVLIDDDFKSDLKALEAAGLIIGGADDRDEGYYLMSEKGDRFFDQVKELPNHEIESRLRTLLYQAHLNTKAVTKKPDDEIMLFYEHPFPDPGEIASGDKMGVYTLIGLYEFAVMLVQGLEMCHQGMTMIRGGIAALPITGELGERRKANIQQWINDANTFLPNWYKLRAAHDHPEWVRESRLSGSDGF